MSVSDDRQEGWRTSSYTGGENCVEVRTGVGEVDIRDTKDRQGGMLTFSADAFEALKKTL